MKRSQLLNSPAARVLHVDRHDRRARLLCEEDNALPEFVGRTTWTVRGDDDILAAGAMISASCRMALAPCRELDPLFTTWKSKRSTRLAGNRIAPSRLALMSAAPLRSGR